MVVRRGKGHQYKGRVRRRLNRGFDLVWRPMSLSCARYPRYLTQQAPHTGAESVGARMLLCDRTVWKAGPTGVRDVEQETREGNLHIARGGFMVVKKELSQS